MKVGKIEPLYVEGNNLVEVKMLEFIILKLMMLKLRMLT